MKEFYILIFILLTCIELHAQKDTIKDKINVIHSEYFIFEKSGEQELQYLQQDVVIKHKQTYLFCDSAIILGLKVKAFGHVRIVEGDSLQIFGDTLNYDGKKLKADLIGNVILLHHGKQLFTTKLNYDLKKRIASYTEGGLLITDNTKMKSKKAYYYAKTEQAYFKDSVNIILENGMNVQSDTIQFDSKKNKVQFLAPTTITQDELNIFCEDGYYDVTNKLAYLDQYPIYKNKSEKAEAKLIISDESKKITTLIKDAQISDSTSTAKGDTIIINDVDHTVNIYGHGSYKDKDRLIEGSSIKYNRISKSLVVQGSTQLLEGKQSISAKSIVYAGEDDIGYAYENVIVTDTQSGFTIHCDTFFYNKKEKKFVPIGLRKYISTPMDKDTLYLTADELISVEKIDEKDSFQVLIANHHVRIWSKRLQGLCDSLFYSGKDSLFSLFKEPVLWSDTTQFIGDTILLTMRDKSIDQIQLLQNAFILTESNTQLYNQIKGRNIFAYFLDKKIHYSDIYGNAETIYFVQEDNKDYIGMNYIKCSKMRIDFLDNEKIDLIHFYSKPEGNLLPISQGKEKRLEGFLSRSKEKPLNFLDLFN
ncbi:MAG: OstA-like protein [Saprospiraceae bacterium]